MSQKGVVLREFPLLVQIVMPTELHDEQLSMTSTRTKASHHCGVDLVSVRAVPEGIDRNVVKVIAKVHGDILPTVRRYFRGRSQSCRWSQSRPRSCTFSHRPFLPSRSRDSRMARKSADRHFPCTSGNGNFSRICKFNVDSSSTVLRMSSSRTVSFNTSWIWNFTR